MNDERLGERVRRLPGVLDCSTHAEAVVVVLDPSADEQVVKARGQAVLAELGDSRPLVVLTGQAAEKLKASSLWASLVPADATPIGLAVFAIAAVCVMALSGGKAKRPGTAALIPPLEDTPANAVSESSLTPELSHWHVAPVVEEVALPPAPVVEAPAAVEVVMMPVKARVARAAFTHSVRFGSATRSTSVAGAEASVAAAAPAAAQEHPSHGAFGLTMAAAHKPADTKARGGR